MRKLFTVSLLLTALLIILAGCGGSLKVHPPGRAAFPTILSPQSLNEALAELDALETPEGVDAALFEELKDTLKEAFFCRARTCGAPLGDSAKMVDGGAQACSPRRVPALQGATRGVSNLVSTPPTGDANKITDLTITDNGGGTYRLTWHYRNLGDYDQDGVVGISDITPLAQHYNEDYDIEDVNCLLAVIDGSGNGAIDIADITPIAMNFGVEVLDYAVEGAASVEGEFAEIGAVGITSATGKDTGRAVFEYALTPGENGYFRVLPRDSDGTPGEASNVVGLALEVLSVSPLEVKEDTVVTFSAEVIGAGPIDYAWDFGGQAVPGTSTAPEPQVALTREVGEFSASLTVTNPQGDMAFPFTINKLAREWKYETILSNVDIATSWPQMKVHGDKLWIHACESSLSPPPNANYVVTGSPGNWEIEEVAFQGMLELNSEGKPGAAYRGGVFLDEVLSFAELREGNWQTTELLGARIFDRVNFVYANGKEPAITFTMPDERSKYIEYFWCKGGEWERGIVDEPGSTGVDNRMATVCAKTDPEGNPVICYVAAIQITPYTYFQLRVAWWLPQSETWNIIPVEGGPDEDEETGATGFFPAMDFRPDGRLAVVYSRIRPEVEPDVRYDRLIYAVYNGETWEKELVDELSYTPYSKRYQNAGLAYDPLGQPIIIVNVSSEIEERDLRLFWRDEGEWQLRILAEGGDTGIQPSIALDSKGTLFITYYNASTEEVIIGVYE